MMDLDVRHLMNVGWGGSIAIVGWIGCSFLKIQTMMM